MNNKDLKEVEDLFKSIFNSKDLLTSALKGEFNLADILVSDEVESPEMQFLIDNYIVLNIGGKTVVANKNRIDKVNSWVGFLQYYSYMKEKVKVVDKKNTTDDKVAYKVIEKPIVERFLTDKAERAEDIVFKPSGQVKKGEYNYFKGWPYSPVEGDKHKKFLEHIHTNICSEDVELYNYVLDWMAQILQFPEVKEDKAIVLRGSQGCLDDDTKINIKINNNGWSQRDITIKELYELFHSTSHTYKTKSFDGENLRFNIIKDVVDSGEKECFELRTESGKAIVCSAEHPFKVPTENINGRGLKMKDNFVQLKDLIVGEEIMVEGHLKKRSRKKTTPIEVVSGKLPFHPYAKERRIKKEKSDGEYSYKRLSMHIAVYEAHLNNMTLNEYIDVLNNDEIRAKGLCFVKPEYVVHHFDEDRTNNAISNLIQMTKIEHDRYHFNKNKVFMRRNHHYEKIVSIKSVGIKHTYDIYMSEPHSNFVADGIVVHNTGKGVFVKQLGFLLGDAYHSLTTPGPLIGRFNSELANRLLIFADEVTWGGNKAEGARLKTFISEDRINIEFKGKDSIPMNNFARLIIASNSEWVIPVEGGDRRYVVIDVGENRKDDKAYFQSVIDDMKNGGRESLMFELLNRDISKRDWSLIPKTAARADQKLLTMEPHEKWLFDSLNGDISMEATPWGLKGPNEKIRNADIHSSYRDYMKNHYPNSYLRTARELSQYFTKIFKTKALKNNAVTYRIFDGLDTMREMFEKNYYVDSDIWE